MPTYNIKVMQRGKISTATLSAKNIEEARNLAAKRGQIISVKAVKSGGFFDTMSLPDRMIFLQRLSAMLGSKMGTSEALEVIYQSFGGTVKSAARILIDEVAEGRALHLAMEAAGPKYFPETVVAIVRTGSQGGDTALALREAARFEKEIAATKKQSSKGLGTALMGFMAGVITIFASTEYVAPMILKSSLVSSTGNAVDIGWIMTMASVVSWVAGVIGAIIGMLFIYGVVLRPLSPAAVDRGIQKIPLYRDMALARNNYMVFFGMSVLMGAGLRVEEVLRLTIESAPKGELKNDLMRAWKAVKEGSSKPWPYHMNMLHATDRAALATAQDRTQMAQTVHELAIQYQALYQTRLEQVVPILNIFAAVFLSLAGFVLFGVSMVPLLQSTSSIMKGI